MTIISQAQETEVPNNFRKCVSKLTAKQFNPKIREVQRMKRQTQVIQDIKQGYTLKIGHT